jgi:hypothetical protein
MVGGNPMVFGKNLRQRALNSYRWRSTKFYGTGINAQISHLNLYQ